ncbi:uncharacterized protein LOC144156190 [Haemaphysalis longicornis]
MSAPAATGQGSPSKSPRSSGAKEGNPPSEKRAGDKSASENLSGSEKSGTERSGSGSNDKSDDKSHSKSKDLSKGSDKSGEKSNEKNGSKRGSRSGSRSGSKSGSRSAEKSAEKTSGEKSSKSPTQEKSKEQEGESTMKDPEEILKKAEEHLLEKTQEKSQDGAESTKVGSGSQRDSSQQQQGDGMMGDDKGLEGINALPEMSAMRLMYENALLNVRNRQLQWLMSELKQEHLETLLQVGRLRKRRGTHTGPKAVMVDRAVSAAITGADVAAHQPVTESSAARYDESRYANLPSVTVNIEDKGISAQDESLYAFGRGGRGVRKCKHVSGPEDDLNWEKLQSHLLPAFYTF